MSNSLRFITVTKKNADTLKQIIIDQAIRTGVTELYNFIKKTLQNNQVEHDDHHKAHPNSLPQRGDLFSVYYDPSDNRWKSVNH